MISTYRVRISNWHPVRLNMLVGWYWAKINRLKRSDAVVVACHVRAANVPRAGGKRRVGLIITLGPHQRGGDPDAYWKSTLDALTEAGAIVDDSPAYVELAPVEYEHGNGPATTITLEDLP